MRPLITIGVALAGALLLVGCHERRAGVTTPLGDGVDQWGKRLPYDHWQFNFFHPKNLPSLVTQVYLEDGDIRGTIFQRLDPTEPSQSSVDKWSRVVGGFSANFNVSKALPVRMSVCWDSVIDKKSYETEIWFSRETWQQMTTTYADTYQPGNVYYRDNMIIGLAPGGTVRIWLEDNGNPVVLQKPAKQFTMTGSDMLICKGITKHPNGYVYYGKIPEFIKGKTYPYGEW
uniref:DUF2931 family protein n=1 Tax=Scandinavium goeteborgense TaxID=1851514 RepID=UPI001359B32E|nr:DUF2931 family protein [Scandinavium goeteborgense]